MLPWDKGRTFLTVLLTLPTGPCWLVAMGGRKGWGQQGKKSHYGNVVKEKTELEVKLLSIYPIKLHSVNWI